MLKDAKGQEKKEDTEKEGGRERRGLSTKVLTASLIS